MILEFSCSNHRSIKDEVSFSMLAGTDTSMEGNVFDFSNYRVLRSAVVYGANGSGKTSLINAISFMQNMVVRSITHQPGQKINQRAHKLSSGDTPSEYNIQFVKTDRRYAYGFTIVRGLIDEEYLYYFPNGRKVAVFDRKGMEVTPGNKYIGAFGLAKDALKDNRLFLSCAANFSSVSETEQAYKFFSTDLVIYSSEFNDSWTEQSLMMMQNDPDLKDLFVKFLQSFGTDAKDIKIRSEKVRFNDLPQSQRDFLSDSAKELMSKTDGIRMDAKISYNDFDVDLVEESSGVRHLFRLICPIIDILRNDKVLICDELENSLHEFIVYQIVQLFQDRNPDQFAQLIFSTHDTTLLDAGLFRRDQIWFTQLREDRSTDLYSLVELKDVRKTEDKSRQYLKGKYGGIPVLKDEFFDDFKINN